MGLVLIIKNADYTNNVNLDYDFDILSNNVKVSYDGETLSLKNIGSSGNYEFAASSSIISATAIVPVDSNVSVSSIIIGTYIGGYALVLYLDGSGMINAFGANGIPSGAWYVIPGDKPIVPKGSPVTITHHDTYFTISYSGYTKNVNYNSQTGYVKKCIGELTTSNETSNFPFT